MNKKQIEYNAKYRKGKKPLYVWVDHGVLSEFKMICLYRGLKIKFVLEKLLVDFNRKNEVKVLE